MVNMGEKFVVRGSAFYYLPLCFGLSRAIYNSFYVSLRKTYM